MLKARHYNAIKEIKIIGTKTEIIIQILNLMNELERRKTHATPNSIHHTPKPKFEFTPLLKFDANEDRGCL